jgi:hypothetical protein
MKKSQTQKLIEHFDKGLSITTFEAYSLYGITTVGQRCTELRKAGYPLESPTKMITLANGQRVAQYRKKFESELF